MRNLSSILDLKMQKINILLGDEVDGSTLPNNRTLKARKVYTGQRLQGELVVHHDERPGLLFDAVHVVLEGIVYPPLPCEQQSKQVFVGYTSSQVVQGRLRWQVKKPVSRF